MLNRYSTEIFAQRAVDIIRTHNQTQPLLLYVAMQSAHSPLEVPDKFASEYASHPACQQYRTGGGSPAAGPSYVCGGPGGGKYCPCNRMVVSAMVTALDAAVGNITDALVATGMWEHTVFVFAGDNGGPQMLSHWNGGLRGGKWTWFVYVYMFMCVFVSG